METKSLTVAIQVCISILKKCNHQLIISSLFFCLASRSLSCNSLNNGTNGCEDLDSICMVKKIGIFFGVSSKIWLSWIKEWSVAMGILLHISTQRSLYQVKLDIFIMKNRCWKIKFKLKKGLVTWLRYHTHCIYVATFNSRCIVSSDLV